MLARITYRGRQFFNIASTRIKDEEREATKLLLNPAQQELFCRMTALAQRHCLNVYHTLREGGCEDGDLLRAALLHDVGKEEVGLSHRVACVVLRRMSPAFLERLADDRPGGWRYGLYANLHHPQRGADLVEATGASATTVDLIRSHQDKGSGNPKLLVLQRADEAN